MIVYAEPNNVARYNDDITLHYIKSYLECPKSLGPLEHYMRLKE